MENVATSHAWTHHFVIHQPAVAATAAIVKLSIRTWRIILPCPAPSAIRVAYSRARPILRASERFARLAQAIRNTKHAAAQSEPQMIDASPPLLPSAPESMVGETPRLVAGYAASNR